MAKETLYIIGGIIFVLIFFWLLLKSMPKKRHMSSAELMAYEQEKGRLRASKDWHSEEAFRRKQGEQAIKQTKQARKAFRDLSGEKW